MRGGRQTQRGGEMVAPHHVAIGKLRKNRPLTEPLRLTAFLGIGDSDGEIAGDRTLGGLVGLGRPGSLERAMAGALEDARWCASDSICIESKGQGPDSLNLAACHACALLPETSCEFQNRVLDRGAVKQFFEMG